MSLQVTPSKFEIPRISPVYGVKTSSMFESNVATMYNPDQAAAALSQIAYKFDGVPGLPVEPGVTTWRLNTRVVHDGKAITFWVQRVSDNQWLLARVAEDVVERTPPAVETTLGYVAVRELFLLDLIQKIAPGTMGATVHAEMCLLRQLMQKV